MLYFASVWLIFTNKDKDRRNNLFFFWFSTALLVCITIQVAVQGVFGEMMWITNANYPGGSAAYFADNSAVWYETMGSAASILLTLLSDWLLVRPSPRVRTGPPAAIDPAPGRSTASTLCGTATS